MENGKYFNGSIVIADPCYFMKSDEDWQKCEWGKRMDVLGFSDFLLIEFPEDCQLVFDCDTKELLGGVCSDSCQLVVVYKNELQQYRDDYEQSFYAEENRAIIDDFNGKVGYRVENVKVDDEVYEDIIIYGEGTRRFRSYNSEDVKSGKQIVK